MMPYSNAHTIYSAFPGHSCANLMYILHKQVPIHNQFKEVSRQLRSTIYTDSEKHSTIEWNSSLHCCSDHYILQIKYILKLTIKKSSLYIGEFGQVAWADMMMPTITPKRPRALPKISMTNILTNKVEFCASERAQLLPMIPTHNLQPWHPIDLMSKARISCTSNRATSRT